MAADGDLAIQARFNESAVSSAFVVEGVGVTAQDLVGDVIRMVLAV